MIKKYNIKSGDLEVFDFEFDNDFNLSEKDLVCEIASRALELFSKNNSDFFLGSCFLVNEVGKSLEDSYLLLTSIVAYNSGLIKLALAAEKEENKTNKGKK